jgi:hypothetical protein
MNKTKCLKALTICILTMLSGCQSSDTSKGTVEKYMKALSSGNSQLAMEYKCHLKDGQITLPPEIKTWEVLKQEPKTENKDPDSKYNIVSVRIESMSIGGFPVTRTWNFDVWKSDELFESNKRFADKTNRLFKDSSDLLNRTSKFLGKQPTLSPAPMWSPDRKEISSKLYCITRAEPSDG